MEKSIENQYLRTQLVERKHKLEMAMAASSGDASLAELGAQVDVALDRMEKGTYGICEECHEPVEQERLLANPLECYCLDHLTAPQRIHLRLHADAAVNQSGAELEMLAVGAHIFVYLRSQLPRRGEDQYAHGAQSRSLCEPLQDGKREARRLSGAGLGGAEQIAAGQHDRYRLYLNRGGLGVALLCDSAEQLGAQAESFE